MEMMNIWKRLDYWLFHRHDWQPKEQLHPLDIYHQNTGGTFEGTLFVSARKWSEYRYVNKPTEYVGYFPYGHPQAVGMPNPGDVVRVANGSVCRLARVES